MTRYAIYFTTLFFCSSAFADAAKEEKKPAVAVKATDKAKTVADTAAKPIPATKVETKQAPKEEAKPKQSFWQGVLVLVLEAVLAIATPIIVILLTILLRKWKLNIEVEKVQWVVDKATGFGEQKLRNVLRDGHEPNYSEIKKDSLSFGEKLLKESGLLKKWGDYFADLIEAKLGESKLKGPEAPKTVGQKKDVASQA